MIAWLAAFTFAALTASTQADRTDTRIPVQPGTRLELTNFSGSISVQTWADNAVRVSAEHSPSTHIKIDPEGPLLRLMAESRHGVPTSVEYHLTVPKWMSPD